MRNHSSFKSSTCYGKLKSSDRKTTISGRNSKPEARDQTKPTQTVFQLVPVKDQKDSHDTECALETHNSYGSSCSPPTQDRDHIHDKWQQLSKTQGVQVSLQYILLGPNYLLRTCYIGTWTLWELHQIQKSKISTLSQHLQKSSIKPI